MRPIAFLALLPLLAASPSAAQGVLVPADCRNPCTDRLTPDSIRVYVRVKQRESQTTVDQVFRIDGPRSLEAELAIPIPDGGRPTSISVQVDGRMTRYTGGGDPVVSRSTPGGDGMQMYFLPIGSVAPGSRVEVRLDYAEMLQGDGRVLGYRYPLAAAGPAAVPSAVRLGMTIWSDNGFHVIGSATHPITVRMGDEMGPCHPRAACGSMGHPSERIRVVSVDSAGGPNARDFVLTFAPTDHPVGPPVPYWERLPSTEQTEQ